MLKDWAVVCMSSLDWHFSWHPNQEIMYRMAEAGNQVLYVETTGVRRIRTADWRRVLLRLRAGIGFPKVTQRVHKNIRIYSPLVLPFPHFAPANGLNRRIVSQALRTWIARQGDRPVLFWVYLASPLTVGVIQAIQPNCTVYHYMSDVTASRAGHGVLSSESALLQTSHLVLANSLRLYERARSMSSQVRLFRAGVDVEAFQRRATQAADPPAEMRGLRSPIALYIGSVHEWVDLRLLAQVAAMKPDWQIVMIGPILRDVSELRSLPNIHWFGQRPHEDLPGYIRHADVCLIPYVMDQYTASAYPGKLNEYLALGKPVVATALPELVDYNREFDGVLYLADDPAGFVSALEQAQGEQSDQVRRQRVAAAQANSWNEQLQAISSLVEANRTRGRQQ